MEKKLKNQNSKINKSQDNKNLNENINININENEKNFNSNNKFKKEIDEAIFICSQSKSKKYELPDKKDLNVDDKLINYSLFNNTKFEEDFNNSNLNLFFEEKLNLLKKLINNFNDKLKTQNKNIILKLNSLEILNSLINISILTSKEINKSYKKNSTYFEFVISTLNNNSEKETEFIVYENINNIYNFDFENFFNKIINSSFDTSKSTSIENFKGKIILTEKASLDFFNPELSMNSIIGHCSGRLKFLKISKFEKEQKILDSKKDKLTIYSNPLIEDNLSSIPFDSDGISAKKLCLIKDNIFKNNFTTKQYSDYLGISANGPFGVIEIESGNKTKEDLFKDDDELIEIISFASFSPDLVSGDFSAEIRLGYKIKNGIKIPFKGGLFSGNIFKILEDVEFSKEKINEVGYFGPKYIKFFKGEIIGF